jgi:hypothetical protein
LPRLEIRARWKDERLARWRFISCGLHGHKVMICQDLRTNVPDLTNEAHRVYQTPKDRETIKTEEKRREEKNRREEKKGIPMAFDVATIDLSRAHQPLFHGKDITIVMFQSLMFRSLNFTPISHATRMRFDRLRQLDTTR